MTEIPADIRAAATDAWLLACLVSVAGVDMTKEAEAVEQIAYALLAERERCAKIIGPLLRRDQLSLQAGEMTAQEFRTVSAVLHFVLAAIRKETE